MLHGTSRQAASVEELSAALEEISSMTKRNAENSDKTKVLAGEARAVAELGHEAMREMDQAMAAIKESSTGIAKIIKTIDEIAFQTNILALNAAVEAARAGEAGMGFAVVAEEVRNLAQRSAQAAKETTQKIEEAIARSEGGVQHSAAVEEALNEILTKTRQVDELVVEIANASREQSQGITEINGGVAEIDQVTQNNAASAEEGASAAEELTAQSKLLKDVVAELLGWMRRKAVSSSRSEIAPTAEPRKTARKPARQPAKSSQFQPARNGHSQDAAAARPKDASTELSF